MPLHYNSSISKDGWDSSLLPISGAIVVFHCLILVWAIFSNQPKPPSKILAPRLVVQTISLSPPETIIASKPIANLSSLQSSSTEDVSKENHEEILEEPVHKPEEKEVAELIAEELKEPKPVLKQPDKEKPKPKPKQESKPLPKSTPKSEPKKENRKQPAKKTQTKKAEPKQPEKKKSTPPKKAPEPKKSEPKKSIPPKENPAPKKVPKKEKPVKSTEDKELQKKRKAEEQKKLAERQKREAEEQAIKAKQQSLVAKAQERIAKIAQTRDKITPGKGSEISNTVTPEAITSLQIDALPSSNAAPLSEREVSYRDELAGRLKLLLRLPEYGEVKIKLTLEKSGKIAKVVVVNSESSANKKYIEKTLPTLTFPAFGNRFENAEQYTFSITLSNEI